MKHELLLILDFGAQYTQLIARRVRELGVYAEIVPYSTSLEDIKSKNPKAIILSGGPGSVHADEVPFAPDSGVFDLDIPMLGICYGLQIMSKHYGGEVGRGDKREYGRADIETKDSDLFKNFINKTVWMSHFDKVTKLPDGFELIAQTDDAIAAAADVGKKRYGIQFHPEVTHTADGKQLISNFLFEINDFTGDWSMSSFIDDTVAQIKAEVGDKKVISGLSGGVDSSVASSLVAKAIGDQQTCIFVDTGLLRKDEAKQVMAAYEDVEGLNVIHVDASDRFLKLLKGVTDPEKKRKIIGNEFIEVFQEEANKLGEVDFLVQGTLYPDVIESVSVHGPSSVIKSHHNVGGLPEKMDLSLIEPLRELFKDEVRKVGRELGIKEDLVNRHPFPGPGLAVRILGEITEDRVKLLQNADAIVIDSIKEAGLYDEIWQAFSVLLPVNTVGVMGDERTYEAVLAIRCVTSDDVMTADWYQFPHEVLQDISTKVVNQVRGINRVVYDVTSKPPGTIEWE
ncbi:glutamine-hydrolyzing GMP synthase [Candidatus Saccharibacteria bacterium]|jgi:GMP synthase (glutamine-hydrolysing)|nr:glutamine-hydrolyzing GMP synthase [Candidatus Saccharibacteria bacterium]